MIRALALRLATGLAAVLVATAVASDASAQHYSWPEGVPGTHGRPGWLGLSYDIRWVQRDSECLPRVVVESVVEGAPADRAGLREGDRVLALDGRAVAHDALPFSNRTLRPGDSVRLRIARPGATREIVAVADLRPTRPPVTLVRPGDGFSASDAPVVTVEGDSLVARNVDGHPLWSGRGYWLASGEGRAQYRRLDRFTASGVDRRVSELLGCVAQARMAAPAPPLPPPAEQLHRRADSLRVVIARRAMARNVPDVVLDQDESVEALSTPRVQVYAFRTGGEPDDGSAVAGAELTAMEPDLAEYFRGVRDGLLVLRVGSGTPAHRAGLRPGDVITEGGGRRLESVDALRKLLARPDPGRVELRVVRHGRSRLITLQDG